jgi:branched-chain amino acid aminotransferase
MDRYGVLKCYTPLDNGCILSGVTRQSILEMQDQIYRDTGMVIREKNVSIHEIIYAHREGRLVEVIGASTASHVQPINKIAYKDFTIKLDTNQDSQYVSYLNNLLTDIMVGPDTHPWIAPLSL